jgi:drug/metabolite transporter (DMT)-like permease
MPLAALLLALAAAVGHATWNLLIADEEDTQSATAVAVAVGVLVFAPVAAVTWRLESAALPYVAASSVLELVYLALLAAGYAVAAMSFVYPIARGAAPVLVLVVSATALGGRVSLAAALGVLFVALGIVLVRGLGRQSARARHLLLALSVGGCIAAYTLVDQRGVRHASPISYLELVLALAAAAYLAGVWQTRGAVALRAAVGWRTALAGIGVFGAYVLVLAALRLAPAAAVAAVRESSVVIAAIWLGLSGRERVGAERLAGAVAVVAGIALISLG